MAIGTRGGTTKRITGRFFKPSPKKIRLDRILRLVVVFAVVLLIVGIWTTHAMRNSLNEAYTEVLQAILDADITALKLWIRNEKGIVTAWATHPQLRQEILNVAQLAHQPGDITQALKSSPDFRQIHETLRAIELNDDFSGFVVIDRMGRILAASHHAGRTGETVDPKQMTFLAYVFEGETLITGPEMLWTPDPNLPPEPTLFVAAPVYNPENQAAAALVFLIDPEKDFTRILSVARMGETGETYAFDNRGILLSQSRFTQDLREAGAIEPNAPSVLNVQIRDPGGNILKGYKPDVPVAARPLTRMAALAITGVEGIDLKGYRNYRGAEVIGAWRWIKNYDFGVAVEVEKSEAYSLLSPLRRAFVWLFCILTVAATAVAFSAYNIILLQDRIKDIRHLGQYTLEEKLGEGGMGIVYKARHAMLRRPTALKMLKPESMNAEAVARFEREVQLTSQLTHPNTVYIYDFGLTPNGIFYYVMEYLPGANLAQLLQVEPFLPPARVVHIITQACGSLQEAHSIGLVHRDIKPQNILLCRRGGMDDVVKVVDFGLVKDIYATRNIHVTAEGMLAGTPLYIAPERLKDPACSDPRSDIYSLGAVMFNLLTGRNVFTGKTAMDICTKAMTLDPPRVSQIVDYDVPPKLDQLVYDCLAPAPNVRPQSAAAVAEILTSIDLEPWTRQDACKWWTDHIDRIRAVTGPHAANSVADQAASELVVERRQSL